MDSTQEISDWEDLHSLFHLKADTMLLYTNEVRRICSEALTASNIRHPPITSRIKSWESAKGSIGRRNRERALRGRLREAVEAQDRKWEDYARESGLSLCNEETEPLKSPEEMLRALPDFGGIRISLYFPGDLKRVTAILEERFNVMRRIEKGQGAPDNVQSLEERLELLQDPDRNRNGATDTNQIQRYMRTFTGYKATHFVVKLHYKDIQESRRYSWKDAVVEIQIGTLVMHVWSEIEHDMIYKPLDSQGAKVSEDEERILDLINGLVLTGEAALQQLEASTAKRLNKRAEDQKLMASSHYELATWIEKDCEERGILLEGAKWRNLEQLFNILKTTESHRHSEVTKLIEDATQQTSSRNSLPAEILWSLCKNAVYSEWEPSNNLSVDGLIENAKVWALRLVHSVNFAMYLGVVKDLLDVHPLPNLPSMVSFLDLVHPDSPKGFDPNTAETIAKCCRAIVDPETRPGVTSNTLVRVAMSLPVTKLVGMFTESSVSLGTPIPASITLLLPVKDKTDPGMNFQDADEPYRAIELIDFYLDSSQDQILIWDRLTRQLPNSQTRKPIENRFFFPTTFLRDSWGWKLVDVSAPLSLAKMDPKDLGASANCSERPSYSVAPPCLITYRHSFPEEQEDGVLDLAYRFYPKEQWDAVRKAWGMVKALRPKYLVQGRKSEYSIYRSEGISHSEGSMNFLSRGSFIDDGCLIGITPNVAEDPSELPFLYDELFGCMK
ncbi:hypothetical protein P170DRAFT_510241 [Aspergillus steynii IBT 23096]|uniref:RelA/SpoT domain-containing protein n=1 Tax=Aspergillus steynii IBT 23096 TaxID=1392250 RepID=A0A2I2GA73_9EURO|nr:uncharacterized protein P170DRAFT_510241 [Aspergillus steynii IBT 23096]PLB49771.1 hypothetical protein P170DRAFT_510241 [Aspergillus steynii IBT 23096]